MAIFIIYDSTTGQILRTGSCSDGMESIQAQTGEGVILGTADQTTQYVDVSSHNLVSIPAQTTLSTVFDWSSHTWIEPTGDALTVAQLELLSKLSSEFHNRLNSGISYTSGSNVYNVPTDSTSVQEFINTWQFHTSWGGSGAMYFYINGTWTATVGSTDINAIAINMMDYLNQVRGQYHTYQTAINNAYDTTTLNAIDVTTGWPTNSY
jgi:hypothetical protein